MLKIVLTMMLSEHAFFVHFTLCSSFIMAAQLRNTFLYFFYTPLFSLLLFSLCGEDQIERARRQFKGQTQVPASRAFTSALTESRVNHWEMFHRSRHIMQLSESHIKLSLTSSFPHFYCPACLLTNF